MHYVYIIYTLYIKIYTLYTLYTNIYVNKPIKPPLQTDKNLQNRP
jgi:hypothetical protein